MITRSDIYRFDPDKIRIVSICFVCKEDVTEKEPFIMLAQMNENGAYSKFTGDKLEIISVKKARVHIDCWKLVAGKDYMFDSNNDKFDALKFLEQGGISISDLTYADDVLEAVRKAYELGREEMRTRVVKLQVRIDDIIDTLFAARRSWEHLDQGVQAVDDCIDKIFPGRKDPFCEECIYTSNNVLDLACNRSDCGRF